MVPPINRFLKKPLIEYWYITCLSSGSFSCCVYPACFPTSVTMGFPHLSGNAFPLNPMKPTSTPIKPPLNWHFPNVVIGLPPTSLIFASFAHVFPRLQAKGARWGYAMGILGMDQVTNIPWVHIKISLGFMDDKTPMVHMVFVSCPYHRKWNAVGFNGNISNTVGRSLAFHGLIQGKVYGFH